MRRILLAYCSFVVACLFVIAVFMTATTYTQLTIAILLYPVLVWFAYKTFPRKARLYMPKEPLTSAEQTVKSVGKVGVTDIAKGTVGIADIDKRVFLKLIGGMGLTLFIFSLFNKKPQGLFSGGIPASGSVSIQGTDGKKIEPAQTQPTDGYKISELDDSTVFTFYGFTNKDGAWYVMRGDADTGSFRYARGGSNFPGNWINRENLKYDYYSSIFRS